MSSIWIIEQTFEDVDEDGYAYEVPSYVREVDDKAGYFTDKQDALDYIRACHIAHDQAYEQAVEDYQDAVKNAEQIRADLNAKSDDLLAYAKQHNLEHLVRLNVPVTQFIPEYPEREPLMLSPLEIGPHTS